MATGTSEQQRDKSYLTSAVESINPWAAKRTSSPASGSKKNADEDQRETSSKAPVDPRDHSITHLYGQSFRTYPSDCPPLNVQWFHAIDVAKRKPKLLPGSKSKGPDTKQPAQAKKFSAFSISDSKAIESRYQKLLESAEEQSGQVPATNVFSSSQVKKDGTRGESVDNKDGNAKRDAAKVPVNEDFLFDVSIEERELAPVYWLGPVYEVRRGTWFFQEGSSLRPCEENLAAQLEEGYLKLKPWLNPVRSRSQSAAKKITPKPSKERLEAATGSTVPNSPSLPKVPGPEQSSQPPQTPLQSQRLFGSYMNSVATYQDATTAWLSSDTMLSWVTSSVYERFAGGGYMSGVKLTRGYSEPAKGKDNDKEKPETSSAGDVPGLDERQQKLLKRRSAPPTATSTEEEQSDRSQTPSGSIEDRGRTLQRQLSSLIEGDVRSSADAEEQNQQLQEQEIQGYHTQAGESQAREVDHLVLVTHGIGQQLSLRMDSINFVHDVNVLRKTLKTVYTSSADLKALNSELGAGNGNCRVQVLPVCWRHLLDFPRQRERRDEHDLGDVEEGEFTYPSLDDITVEGVAFARSLISDLALDVLLYQSSYREEISRIVLKECNRIFNLYKERNPGFTGKVHVMGHSLGSAILFDILCRQKDAERAEDTSQSLRFWPSQNHPEMAAARTKGHEMAFGFDVDNFFCLGSPIGLFQMLEGRTIAARPSARSVQPDSVSGGDTADEPLLSVPRGTTRTRGVSPTRDLVPSVSSPKVCQMFNIFHPSDPISYRVEPLISPAMTSLKPQGLPYTKKGLLNAANQGLTGIGTKVGQSVSGLWSSLSAGIANNMINRSLGLTNEEVAKMADQVQSSSRQHAPGDGTNSPQGKSIAHNTKAEDRSGELRKQLAGSAASGEQISAGGDDPTLINHGLETLFSNFQKRRAEPALDDDGAGKLEDELRKVRRMRVEENKVRALNRNGRVDYSIQESVLDFNPMNTIASHMSYWSDVDVSHFVLSQLLSHQSKEKMTVKP